MNESTVTVTLPLEGGGGGGGLPGWVVVLLVLLVAVGVVVVVVYLRWWFRQRRSNERTSERIENPMMQLNDAAQGVEMPGWIMGDDGELAMSAKEDPASPAVPSPPDDEEDHLQWMAYNKALVCIREGDIVEAAQNFNKARGRPPRDPLGETTALMKIVELTSLTPIEASDLLKLEQRQQAREAEGWPKDWGQLCYNRSYPKEKKPKQDLYTPLAQGPPPLSTSGDVVI